MGEYTLRAAPRPYSETLSAWVFALLFFRHVMYNSFPRIRFRVPHFLRACVLVVTACHAVRERTFPPLCFCCEYYGGTPLRFLFVVFNSFPIGQ